MIKRLWAMRLQNDRTALGLLFYMVATGLIIVITLILIFTVDWSAPISQLIGG
jgi:hypothetical protein